MKERPILFSAPMVRAILDGSKTHTRRVLKKQPPVGTVSVERWHHPDPRDHFWAYDGKQLLDFSLSCPYGQPADHHWYPQADRLWVRETFCPIYPQDPSYNGGKPIEYDYAATYQNGDRLGDSLGIKKGWKPSIHMPRDASRILLEVTGVRVERLNDCSEADAIAEGIRPELDGWLDYGNPSCQMCTNPVDSYRTLWETINGAGSWEANPWVWVVEFKGIELSEFAQDISGNRFSKVTLPVTEDLDK